MGVLTNKDQLEQARLRAQVNLDVQNAATRFAEHDEDGNMSLDFEEFYAMQPRAVRDQYTAEDIRQWFDAADADGSGDLSVDEFFLWSLSNAATKFGSGSLEAAFARYDKDGTGALDLKEFSKACADMGFGSAATSIFHALDADGSGEVSYRELQAMVASGAARVDREGKRLLATLVWSFDKGANDERHETVTASQFQIKSNTAEGVRDELKAILRTSGNHVADILKLFDMDADTALLIDDVEFYRAMRDRFGFRGHAHILREVFNMLDTDRSGSIGFDELCALPSPLPLLHRI